MSRIKRLEAFRLKCIARIKEETHQWKREFFERELKRVEATLERLRK